MGGSGVGWGCSSRWLEESCFVLFCNNSWLAADSRPEIYFPDSVEGAERGSQADHLEPGLPARARLTLGRTMRLDCPVPGRRSGSISGLCLPDASHTCPAPAVTTDMSPGSVRPLWGQSCPEPRAAAPQTVLGLTLTPWWASGGNGRHRIRGACGNQRPPVRPPKAARPGGLVRGGREETPPAAQATRGRERAEVGTASPLSRALGSVLLEGRCL